LDEINECVVKRLSLLTTKNKLMLEMPKEGSGSPGRSKYQCTVKNIAKHKNPEELDQAWLRTIQFTPRTQEAFRMSGVLPSDILYPKLEHFFDPQAKFADELAEIKLKKAVQARENKLKVLVRDYKKLLNADGGWDAESSNMHSRHQESHMENAAIAKTSAMIEMEKEKIARIKIKQQMEVERMLEDEFRRQAKLARNAEKEALKAKKEREIEEAKHIRHLQALEKGRIAEEKRMMIIERDKKQQEDKRSAADHKEAIAAHKQAIKEEEEKIALRQREAERER
jgi:hypothetical protein